MCAAFLVFAPLAAIAQLGLGLGETKVTICHVPPGNAANQHTITVGLPALAGHEGHGDFVGGCTCGNFEGALCGNGLPPCCAAFMCVAGACVPATSSMPMPVGGACNSDADCDPLNPCVFIAPNDGVCGGELF